MKVSVLHSPDPTQERVHELYYTVCTCAYRLAALIDNERLKGGFGKEYITWIAQCWCACEVISSFPCLITNMCAWTGWRSGLESGRMKLHWHIAGGQSQNSFKTREISAGGKALNWAIWNPPRVSGGTGSILGDIGGIIGRLGGWLLWSCFWYAFPLRSASAKDCRERVSRSYRRNRGSFSLLTLHIRTWRSANIKYSHVCCATCSSLKSTATYLIIAKSILRNNTSQFLSLCHIDRPSKS